MSKTPRHQAPPQTPLPRHSEAAQQQLGPQNPCPLPPPTVNILRTFQEQ
jgi:hypothetical protein